MNIKFLYGTQSGNAEVLAKDMADVTPEVHTTSVHDIDGLDTDVFDGAGADDLFVIVISTYGEGDYPFTAEEFFEDLEDQSPDLSGVKYAVFGLGDTSYDDSYNMAGKNADALLTKLGATRIGTVGEYDASSGDDPEDSGMPWWQSIIGAL